MKPSILRCAIYTRKSSEEGLQQDFNSLDAQRESCFAYIASQKSEGWTVVKRNYDDGGFSGGGMERPALKQMLEDIKAGKINVIVVYKIDRLTRSLMDFSRLVEIFDEYKVTFVSVTQSFNTTTSMGRLTLNVLLSFAQFEREVTGERIRDKVAASKQKGMWMGGVVPLGYEVRDRKLIINTDEASNVRHIFQRYLELGNVRALTEDLIKSEIKSRKGCNLSRGCLYKMLSNPLYIGQVRHRTAHYVGQHEAIIDQDLWDKVQRQLAENVQGSDKKPRRTEASLLFGKLFDESGKALTPSHANKKGQRYRYYISQRLTKDVKGHADAWRLPAREVEQIVIEAAQQILNDKSMIAGCMHDAGFKGPVIADVLGIAIVQSKKLSSRTDSAETLYSILQRVDLSQGNMRLTLQLAPIVENQEKDAACPVLVKDIPLQIRRRGVEMKLVIEGPKVHSSTDPILIKAVARGRIWFEELQSGAIKTIHDIALKYNVSDSYIRALLPLAFLAPDIVEAIVQGQQPVTLTADRLIKHIDLPIDWAEQRRVLGFLS
jgi:DNA invertase Pin-like site-specific DNA recombinase